MIPSPEELRARCTRALIAAGVPPSARSCAWMVPGRIEVLGKHTDYLGGRNLLAATELGLTLVASPRTDDCIRITDVRSGAMEEFRISAELQPEAGHWRNYPMTVARRLARNFAGPLHGAEIAFASSLPAAAGMSSSSALMIAVFFALSALNHLDATETYRSNIANSEDLAGYLASVENGASFRGLAGDRGVGTQGGSEDHTAILCARAGHLVQYAFGPVRLERAVPMPPGHIFAVAASGVRAEKTGQAMVRYNRLAQLGQELREYLRSENDLSDPVPEDGELAKRLRHFLAESEEIVPAAGDALAAGDVAAFGVLVDRSQHLAEQLLGNQVPETVALAQTARELGAAAASAFGAGFGGSVWALVGEQEAAEFIERWRSRYLDRFPEHMGDAAFFLTRAGPSAQRIA